MWVYAVMMNVHVCDGKKREDGHPSIDLCMYMRTNPKQLMAERGERLNRLAERTRGMQQVSEGVGWAGACSANRVCVWGG